MSIEAQCWVYEWSESTLGSRLVLHAIAYHANRHGENAFPSVQTLARETRMSDRQVRRAIATLEEMGELEVERGAGRNGTNMYRIPGVTQPNLQLINPDLDDKLSGGTNCQGGQIGPEGVTNPTETPDRMSPKQSLTVIEPDDDEARAPSSETLLRQLLEMTGIDDARMPGFAMINEIRCWLSSGATADDIRAAVRDVMAKRRGRPPNSWAYFSKAVADAKATREAGLPEGTPHTTGKIIDIDAAVQRGVARAK